MKRLFLVFAALSSLTAAVAQNVATQIKGTCAAVAKKVYVVNMQSPDVVTDSAAVVGGRFDITAHAQKDALLHLSVAGDERQAVAFFNDGKACTADLAKGTLTGSELNTKFSRCMQRSNPFEQRADSAIAAFVAIRDDSSIPDEARKARLNKMAREETQPAIDTMMAVFYDIAMENQDNLIPVYYMRDVITAYDYDKAKAVLSPDKPYYNHPLLAYARQELARMEKDNAFVGQPVADIELMDTDGKAHKLSEFCGKGRYVLLDFWASWCGPCRQEMPELKAIYKKYHDAGFDIVGLSLDNQADAWRQAITSLELSWIHLSDLKGWKSVAATTYSIRSIPNGIMVGPDGKIVASGMRGHKVEQFLMKAFGF